MKRSSSLLNLLTDAQFLVSICRLFYSLRPLTENTLSKKDECVLGMCNNPRAGLPPMANIYMSIGEMVHEPFIRELVQ